MLAVFLFYLFDVAFFFQANLPVNMLQITRCYPHREQALSCFWVSSPGFKKVYGLLLSHWYPAASSKGNHHSRFEFILSAVNTAKNCTQLSIFCCVCRAIFFSCCKAWLSATLTGFSIETWSPRTSSSTPRVRSSWLTLAWQEPSEYPSAHIHMK